MKVLDLAASVVCCCFYPSLPRPSTIRVNGKASSASIAFFCRAASRPEPPLQQLASHTPRTHATIYAIAVITTHKSQTQKNMKRTHPDLRRHRVWGLGFALRINVQGPSEFRNRWPIGSQSEANRFPIGAKSVPASISELKASSGLVSEARSYAQNGTGRSSEARSYAQNGTGRSSDARSYAQNGTGRSSEQLFEMG